jgi:selenocysteine lyase/cysteine desulfurase
MPLTLEALRTDESLRRHEFPVAEGKVFLAHAGVTALPRRVAAALADYAWRCAEDQQEFAGVMAGVEATRALCGRYLGVEAAEVALLGPTSLGLSLVANGLPWREGDELVCYPDDYPANVYPWLELGRRGVRVRHLEPERLGEITPEVVEAALGPRTRLVALASAHYLTGYRPDLAAIGELLNKRGILFALDAIQTLGAFPAPLGHVDFLSADAHKWLLGPMASGVVVVKRHRFEELRPTLLGAWNVRSPQFVAQPEIRFEPTARRYEPGALNLAGIFGLKAALELFFEVGPGEVAARVEALRGFAERLVLERGCEVLGPPTGERSSGILSFRHPSRDMVELFRAMSALGVVASLRHTREGVAHIRVSPHFYNTESEIERALEPLRA